MGNLPGVELGDAAQYLLKYLLPQLWCKSQAHRIVVGHELTEGDVQFFINENYVILFAVHI